MLKEGFVDEGIKQKVQKQRQEILKEKFPPKRAPREEKRQRAVETLKSIKRHFKKKGACPSCMLKHEGPCKIGQFGVTDLLTENLSIVHAETYRQEAILNKVQYAGADDFCGRVGKVYVDDQFQMNCYLVSDRVMMLRHGLGKEKEEYEEFLNDKNATKRILFKFPSMTLRPKGGYIQYEEVEDIIVFPVQVVQRLQSIPLRKPKVCEPFIIMAWTNDRTTPVFTQGVCGTNGHHSGSTDYGFCDAPLMSLEDKAIIGFHCAGGERSNRFWPLTDELLAFLKKPLN